jgi:hypothetical protein
MSETPLHKWVTVPPEQITKYEDEIKRLREALIQSNKAIQDNLSKFQYKNETILLEALENNIKALEVKP